MKKALILLLVILGISVIPAKEAEAATGKLDWRWPVPSSSIVNSCYLDGRSHYAIDIKGEKGAEVYAAYPGTVIATYSSCTHDYRKSGNCGCDGGLGNNVYIKHTYDGKDYVSRYGHLSTVNVSVGDKITEKRIIGTLGCTGYSTGDHLDFRVYEGTGKSHIGSRDAIDPLEELFIPLPEGFRANGTGCCYSYVSRIKQLHEGIVIEAAEEVKEVDDSFVEVNGKFYNIGELYHIEEKNPLQLNSNNEERENTGLYLTVDSILSAKIFWNR